MDVLLLTASAGFGCLLPLHPSSSNSSKYNNKNHKTGLLQSPSEQQQQLRASPLPSSKSIRLALSLSLALFSLSILEVAPSRWLVLLEHSTPFKKNSHYISSGSSNNNNNHYYDAYHMNHNQALEDMEAITNTTRTFFNFLTITEAYQILLWIFCFGIIVVLPARVGARLFQQLWNQYSSIYYYYSSKGEVNDHDDDADDKKKKSQGYCDSVYCWWKTKKSTGTTNTTAAAAAVHNNFPWWIRYSWKLIRLIWSILYRLVLRPTIRFCMRQMKRLCSYPTESLLPLVSTVSTANTKINNGCLSPQKDTNNNNTSKNTHAMMGACSSRHCINKNHHHSTSSSCYSFPALRISFHQSVGVVGGICGVVTALIILKTLGTLVMMTQPSSSSFINDHHDMPPYHHKPHFYTDNDSTTATTSHSSRLLLSTLVSWLCAVGLLISSMLNGFGSVSLPYSCLAGLFLEPIPGHIVTTAEVELLTLTRQLEEKKQELLETSFSSSNCCTTPTSLVAAPSPTRRRSSSFQLFLGNNNNKPGGFGDYSQYQQHQHQLRTTTKSKYDQLQREIDFMETLIEECKEDVLEMKYAQEEAIKARTCIGTLRSYIGIICSIVLLVRLIMAGKSLLFPSTVPATTLSIHPTTVSETTTTTPMTMVGPTLSDQQREENDPITTGLLWLSGHMTLNTEEYNTLSQGISLLLTALLSVSQIRTFLRTVNAINARIALMYRKCAPVTTTLTTTFPTTTTTTTTTTSSQPSSPQIIKNLNPLTTTLKACTPFASLVNGAGAVTVESSCNTIPALAAASTTATTTTTTTTTGKTLASSTTSSSGSSTTTLSFIHTRIMAGCMGCYFLSCVVLTKMILPLPYRYSFSAALNGNDDSGVSSSSTFMVRTSVVNAVFCISACISVMILSLLFGIQQQNMKRYNANEAAATTTTTVLSGHGMNIITTAKVGSSNCGTANAAAGEQYDELKQLITTGGHVECHNQNNNNASISSIC